MLNFNAWKLLVLLGCAYMFAPSISFAQCNSRAKIMNVKFDSQKITFNVRVFATDKQARRLVSFSFSGSYPAMLNRPPLSANGVTIPGEDYQGTGTFNVAKSVTIDAGDESIDMEVEYDTYGQTAMSRPKDQDMNILNLSCITK